MTVLGRIWRPRVIVCVCRNLNQARVLEAIEAGAGHAAAVHRHHGVKADCGCCLEAIDALIGDAAGAVARAAQ